MLSQIILSGYIKIVQFSKRMCGCQGNYIRFAKIVACPENIVPQKKMSLSEK
jgi:hypothetical protein